MNIQIRLRFETQERSHCINIEIKSQNTFTNQTTEEKIHIKLRYEYTIKIQYTKTDQTVVKNVSIRSECKYTNRITV